LLLIRIILPDPWQEFVAIFLHDSEVALGCLCCNDALALAELKVLVQAADAEYRFLVDAYEGLKELHGSLVHIPLVSQVNGVQPVVVLTAVCRGKSFLDRKHNLILLKYPNQKEQMAL
jgi:hypothetical protein